MEAGNVYQCSLCPASFKSLGGHAHHQKVHAIDPNFAFQCGFLDCLLKFSTFGALSSHISKCHRHHRKEHTGQNVEVVDCSTCHQSLTSIPELVQHLQEEHLAKGTSIMCPFTDCGRGTLLTTKSIFSKHLSQQHKNWREMPTTCVVSVGNVFTSETSGRVNEDADNNEYYEDGGESAGEDNDSDSECSLNITEEEVFKFIGKFYLMLESDSLLPVAVIEKISQNLVFLTDIIQCCMKDRLNVELKSAGLPQEKIDHLICELADSNALYLAHHKNMRGPTFTSEHLRTKYFDATFDSLKLKYYDLALDPLDPAIFAYKSIRETLTQLLSDPTVQSEVAASFKRFEQTKANHVGGRIYKDYIDGSVMEKRNLPAKRIDLIMMQDAFSATSMLTTVRSKHKTLAMYATLGNLRPKLRTKLKAIHLVMLILERHVKAYRQECFVRLQKELADLESNGIIFMGEVVPVYLQFFVGDNLGSHCLGGFVESFTARYFCRFCLITRRQFKADPTELGPDRTQADYRRSVDIVSLANLNNHRGVKEDAILNKLNYFNICDPSLPPCLGHDLFHRILEYDLSKIIGKMVRKGWFSYELLNRRIKAFKFGSSDSRNRPAPVKEDGTKLGGSAVQNWTLLRLLPFICEGLIQPDDEVWRLYLKLKAICEAVCAPEISEEQIEQLDTLIDSYLRERVILGTSAKPKHHYLRHYPALIRKFGPLIHLWAMRFEQKHQFFKKVARRCNNFINLIKTMATKHQMLFSYECTGHRFPESVKCKSQPLTPGTLSEELSALVNTLNLSGSAQVASSIQINGLDYKEGNWLVLKQAHPNCEVGHIESIVLNAGNIFFLITKRMAKFKEDYGLYEIDDETQGELFIQNWAGLSNPRIQEVYIFDEFPHFSLKHSFP